MVQHMRKGYLLYRQPVNAQMTCVQSPQSIPCLHVQNLEVDVNSKYHFRIAWPLHCLLIHVFIFHKLWF